MSCEGVLRFIGYLFQVRKVQGTTASKYLSALRTLHLTRGYAEPALRPAIVKAVLKGRENWDEEVKRFDPKKTRLSVTLDVLKLLKIALNLSNWPTEKKVLMEAVSLICFNGAFRVGEILAKRARTIDPLNDLLKKDIWLSSKIIENKKLELINVRLKSSKESRAAFRGCVIEVFAVPGSSYCAVTAYKK